MYASRKTEVIMMCIDNWEKENATDPRSILFAHRSEVRELDAFLDTVVVLHLSKAIAGALSDHLSRVRRAICPLREHVRSEPIPRPQLVTAPAVEGVA